MKRWIIVLMLMVFVCTGCTSLSDEEKLGDLEFSVVPTQEAPEDILTQIEEKKTNPFQLVYSDGEWKYIVVGYGKQEYGGYSIAVDAVYETQNLICVETTLLGPEMSDALIKAESYPCIILKIENMDKRVDFQ